MAEVGSPFTSTGAETENKTIAKKVVFGFNFTRRSERRVSSGDTTGTGGGGESSGPRG